MRVLPLLVAVLLHGLCLALPNDPVSKAGRLYRYARFPEALQILEPYLKQHPKDVAALMVLADIRLELKDQAGALAAFEAADPIPPEYRARASLTYCDAAVDELLAQRGERGLILADKGVKLEESVNSLFVRGKARQMTGDIAGARADFEKGRARAVAGQAPKDTLDALESALKSLPAQ